MEVGGYGGYSVIVDVAFSLITMSSQKDLGNSFLPSGGMIFWPAVIFMLSLFVAMTELLERVFLRFGLADTDEKLKSCISRFLCPVLLKLSTPYPEARKKVLAIRF